MPRPVLLRARCSGRRPSLLLTRAALLTSRPLLTRNRVTGWRALFRDALLVAIREADAEGVEALYHVAKSLVTEAKAGNALAVKEIGDRLDGRVPQALPGEAGGEYEAPVIDEERMMRRWRCSSRRRSSA